MDSMNAFVSLAVIQLPSLARLLRSSWCPDKDLLVVVIRLGGKDRLSLWKMQGSKKWEVGFESDKNSSKQEVVDIAWSPDGQTIAVAHDPPRITIHSIQDGHQERVLPISSPLQTIVPRRTSNLTNIWWFMKERRESKSSIPDIFKRGVDITGSAHSILKGQPLLDPLQDESQPLTATDLFAFQGTQTQGATVSLPQVISVWPTLPQDLLAASIQSPSVGGQHARPGEDLDEVDVANTDSLLIVSDNSGHLHCFLDGSYPLGTISVVSDTTTTSLFKENELLFAHQQLSNPVRKLTSLRPSIIDIPHLRRRILRDVARTSSSVRELVWYTMRVVRDMRAAWFGCDTHRGARELGPKWIRALEARQKDEFGQEEPYAMLDLTCLLVTGRASESLSDYLGSGEQMSERGLQKWESTMVDGLIKLRDSSEKRVAPACQRLHLLLEEVQGWSQLSQYDVCGIDTAQVKACLDLASRAIVVAGWLAATTRRELVRFREFMAWLKYETSRANTAADTQGSPAPKHDILEVNDYLMTGLVVSPIDKWFMGPVPQFSPHDLGVPEEKHDLEAVIQRARGVLSNRQQMAWQSNIKQKDLSHLDRNLDSLIQELATRCQRIFVEAASATARSAVVVSGVTPAQMQTATLLHDLEAGSALLIRERTVRDPAGAFVQHLLMQTPRVGNRSYLCVVRMRHGSESAAQALHVDVAILDCCVPEQGENADTVSFELLDADFFDSSALIVVYRVDDGGPASIATVGYSDLMYKAMELQKDVNDLAREGLLSEVLQQLKEEQLFSVPLPVVQSRRLTGCGKGRVSLAVNGRVGRRVACVLGGTGLSLEILDMEGEEEEAEMSTVEV